MLLHYFVKYVGLFTLMINLTIIREELFVINFWLPIVCGIMF